MIQGISPTGSKPPAPSQDPVTTQLEQWSEEIGVGSNVDSFAGKVEQAIKYYIDNPSKRPPGGIDGIRTAIEEKCVLDQGKLDVYAANSGEPRGVTIQDIQDVMNIVGITSPAPTVMDNKIFDFLKDAPQGGTPSQQLFLNGLLGQLLDLGSDDNNLKDLKTWGQQEMQSADFKSMTKDAQAFFKEICGC